MDQPKLGVFYREREYKSDGGYTHTEITVYSGREDTIESCIAGAVGNAAGYGTAEAAEQQLQRYTRLRDRGAVGTIDYWSPEFRLTIDWLHYKPSAPEGAELSYCEANVEMPTKPGVVAAAAALLAKLERRMRKVTEQSTYHLWHQPSLMRAALAGLKARRVWEIQAGRWTHDLCTLQPGLDAPLDAPVEYSLTGSA